MELIDFRRLSAGLPPAGGPSVQTLHLGKRLRAVGSRIYFRPPAETFTEFLLFVLGTTLGPDWWTDQKGSEDAHPIHSLFGSWTAWKAANVKEENRQGEIYGAAPSGEVLALIALAYDVFTLKHTLLLPERLIKRLRNRNEFQGARYEITVAALFVRAGFKIDWIKDETTKHCEFLAVHRETGDRIGVEAKSRRRDGVLGRAGALDPLAALKGDVGHLLEDAIAQAPDGIPFAVFIDLNSPATPGTAFPDKPWWDDLRQMIEAYGTATPENPDRFNAIVVTNYSYHYGGAGPAPAGEHVQIVSNAPRHLPSNSKLLTDVLRGVNEYGRIPEVR